MKRSNGRSLFYGRVVRNDGIHVNAAVEDKNIYISIYVSNKNKKEEP